MSSPTIPLWCLVRLVFVRRPLDGPSLRFGAAPLEPLASQKKFLFFLEDTKSPMPTTKEIPMATIPMKPSIRKKCDKVYDLLKRKGIGSGIFRNWLASRPSDKYVSDNELDELYSQLLKFGACVEGEDNDSDGTPPPQRQLGRGRPRGDDMSR